MRNVSGHVANPAALSRLFAPAISAGLILGRDNEKSPVVLRAFRPEPTRIALVGEWWAARLIVFRALALGARVVVLTSNQEQWAGLGEAATGRSDRLRVLPGERPVVVPASRLQPALYVYDVGSLGPAQRPVLGPWQTQLVLLRQLTQRAYPVLGEADVVLTQRLSPEESQVAASALGLTGQTPELLRMLYDDMLGILGAELERYAWVAQTSVEVDYLGAPVKRG